VRSPSEDEGRLETYIVYSAEFGTCPSRLLLQQFTGYQTMRHEQGRKCRRSAQGGIGEGNAGKDRTCRDDAVHIIWKIKQHIKTHHDTKESGTRFWRLSRCSILLEANLNRATPPLGWTANDIAS
jgi:hypothetical protein